MLRFECLLSAEGVNNANGSEVEPDLALSASTLNHPALRTHIVVLLPVQRHSVSACVHAYRPLRIST